MYQVQQSDIDLLGQRIKECYTKIELLNSNYQVIDYLEGLVISGSISINSDSDVRRTYDLTLQFNDPTLLVGQYNKVWFDKLIRIFIGYKSLRTQQIVYYPMGISVFNDNEYQYDSTTNIVSFKCQDLMCTLNGTRNGKLIAIDRIISAGVNIRSSMISTVTQLGTVKKYLIDNINSQSGTGVNVYTNEDYTSVPYDLKFNGGNTTVYEMVSKLRDLYPAYETFFDIDGTFICQKIPTTVSDPLALDKSVITDNELFISEARSNSLSNVHNIVDVDGSNITVDRSSDSCTNSGTQYTVTIADLTSYLDYTTFGIKVNVSNSVGQTLRFNSLASYPIVDSDGIAITAGKMLANTYYAVKFISSKFYLLGQFKVHGMAILVNAEPDVATKTYYETKYNCTNIKYVVNPDSPYAVEEIGEILDPKSDGDYSKIYSDDLAIQRAEYELWKDTNWQDTVSLKLNIIPWLDVNQKIEYQSIKYGDTKQYIIKSLSISLTDWTMEIQMVTFYPLYPNIIS